MWRFRHASLGTCDCRPVIPLQTALTTWEVWVQSRNNYGTTALSGFTLSSRWRPLTGIMYSRRGFSKLFRQGCRQIRGHCSLPNVLCCQLPINGRHAGHVTTRRPPTSPVIPSPDVGVSIIDLVRSVTKLRRVSSIPCLCELQCFLSVCLSFWLTV